jgi:hypothetical protein
MSVLLVGVVSLGLVAAAPAGAEPDPGMSAAGAQELPVPLARAGAFVGWGSNDNGQLTPPAALDGVALREVAMSSHTSLALTADGRVVAWGFNASGVQRVPAAANARDVVDLAAAYNYAGVVDRDGKVLVWGAAKQWADPTDVPAGLTGVVQLALGQDNAYALKSDGTVVAWGNDIYAGTKGLNTPPAGLRARAITANGWSVYALTEQGTVVGWGDPDLDGGRLDLPAATQVPGNVVAVAALNAGGVAMLADGSMVGWGEAGGLAVPDLAGTQAAAIDADPSYSLVLDEDGTFHVAGNPSTTLVPPAEVNGRPVAQFSAGTSIGMIVTRMLRAAPPRVSGTAKVGSTLTGKPGTFSDVPDSVTGQWLANGSPITRATGTKLKVTQAMVGKRIAYRSTAVKAGQDTVFSTSAATVKVPTPIVASKTRVVKAVAAKKAAKVTVAGKVTASHAPTGKAKVAITKGKKTIVTKTVKVAKNGSLRLVVKKFAKLVKKKTHYKSKTGYRGKYKATIRYLGNKQVKSSKATKTFRIKK